jgi:hypothetical protein
MSFDELATITVDTNRETIDGTTGFGTRATHLEDVEMHPIMPIERRAEQEVRQRFGVEGQAVRILQTFTQVHTHTDDSASVTQLPDIDESDWIVDGSDTYNVLAAKSWPATAGMPAYLEIVLEEAE